MGARTMENEKDRKMTMMLVPFMSCSAKMPVYALIAAAFFAAARGFSCSPYMRRRSLRRSFRLHIQKYLFKESGAVHHGAPAVQNARFEKHTEAHVDQGQGFSDTGGYHHPDDEHHTVVFAEL
jgi:hypothetical protein